MYGPRAVPGTGWTPTELNHILQAHVVDSALTTFGCVDWESDLCRGVMRARCYPFDMLKHHFHGLNPKVLVKHCIYMNIHAVYMFCILSTCMYSVYKRLYVSSSLLATFVQKMEEPRRIHIKDSALMTFDTTWSSSAPLRT